MTDFGGKLRQARELRGVSLRQIAASTKIPVAALEALERNDRSRLPGGIFSRAFVRSYALEVGLDPDETVREFDDLAGDQLPAPAPDGLHRAGLSDDDSFESRQRMAGVLVMIIVASFVVAAVIFYLAWRQSSAARSAPPAGQPTSSDRAPTRGAMLQHPWIQVFVRL